MADQSISVNGPVRIQDSSYQRVAYELMIHLHHYSNDSPQHPDQAYWLKLYRKAYKATSGSSLESILKED